MSLSLRYLGTAAAIDDATRRALFDRSTSTDESIRARTRAIIEDVRTRGDAALRDQARQFDGASLEMLEVPSAVRRRALDTLDSVLRDALEHAADNIARVHRAFAPSACEVEVQPGVLVGRRPDPLAAVGVYAPGGRAAYPSSVLMGAVPARVAGVQQVIVCSPADASGAPPQVVLAAAELARADRVFAVGGAGAIAAMAFGTASVPRVDRIVGPGNAFVAEAKLQVSGAVAIDSPAGPSELLVIADESAEPSGVAMELVAQAEHDPRACSVAVVIGAAAAKELETALTKEVAGAARREIVTQSLAANGAIIVVDDTDQAIAFAAAYAPEHLLIATTAPDALVGRVRNAGTVFVGARTSVSFGDYITGANHVLPTGGLSRSYSGLSTLDFVRWTTYQRVTPAAAALLASLVEPLALAEGLPGHAAAACYAGGTR